MLPVYNAYVPHCPRAIFSSVVFGKNSALVQPWHIVSVCTVGLVTVGLLTSGLVTSGRVGRIKTNERTNADSSSFGWRMCRGLQEQNSSSVLNYPLCFDFPDGK
jgi:hypothetical protein